MLLPPNYKRKPCALLSAWCPLPYPSLLPTQSQGARLFLSWEGMQHFHLIWFQGSVCGLQNRKLLSKGEDWKAS